MAKKHSLADELESVRSVYSTFKDAIDRMPEDDRNELLEVRNRYKEGRYACTVTDIWKICKERLGITCSLKTFARWIEA